MGSSSSSTLGSAISSRVSCSRRRSPPESCPTGVHCRAAGKPEPLQHRRRGELAACPSRHVLRHLPRWPPARACPRQVGELLASARRAARCVPLDRRRPPSSGRSPLSARSSVVLPEPLTPTMPIAVAGAEPPGDVGRAACGRRSSTVASSSSSTVRPSRLVANAEQLHRVARRRHVGDQRLGGLDPEPRLRRARGRPAAQPGQLLAGEVLPARLGGVGLPGALGAGEDPVGVAAQVALDPAARDLPGARARRRRGTTGRA